MTPAEFTEVAKRMTARWPHAPLGRSTLAVYYDDLRRLPLDQAIVGLEVLARDGCDFPPTGAQILKQVAELDIDAPDWSTAWSLLLRAVRKFGRADEDGAVAWLAEHHPLLGPFARELPFRLLCASQEGDTTFQAQARDKWKALVRRAQRDVTWVGLPSAGLRALETRTGPRPLAGALEQATQRLAEGEAP